MGFLQKNETNENKAILLATLIVVLLAVLIRIHHLDFESLFMDELRQVSYYPHSLSQIVTDAATQQQPPLDYWIGHFFSKLSYSDFMVRLPAALFGVGSILLMMLLIAKVTNWPTAWGAGIILAVLPYHIYFSQHARPYSIAIFFTLATLYTLHLVITCSRNLWIYVLLFLATTTCFLYSRTLAPLVTVATLTAIFLFVIVLSFTKDRQYLAVIKDRFILALFSVLISLVFYFPVLNKILFSGRRYADSPQEFRISTIYNGLKSLSMTPIWESYVTQLEPLGIIILPFILIAPFLAWRSGTLKRNPILSIIILLIPTVSLINIAIFQAKTSLPFRPPYAIYLLPLCIIVAAVGVYELLMLARQTSRRVGDIAVILLVITLGLLTISHSLDFKRRRINTDWKGLTAYLAKEYSDNFILVFDGLHPYETWEPTFYGFPRYYVDNAVRINLASFPYNAQKLISIQNKPVFVLFYYRDYFITSRSKYPIMPRPHPPIDLSRILSDPILKVRRFTGFFVVEPKNSSDVPLCDLVLILDRLLENLDEGSTLVELHIAAGSLKRALGLKGWEKHIMEAELLAPDRSRPTIESVKAKIMSYPINE